MKRVHSIILILTVGLLLTTPCLWSDDGHHTPGSCKLTGTWYGGSDAAKYQMTLIPRPGDGEDYTLFFFLAQAPPPIPPILTPASGSVRRRHSQNGAKYELFAIAMINTADSPPPPPEVWAVHATGSLSDCDTLTFVYDFFGGYHWPTVKIPFQSPPDYPLAPTPFTETYRRMSTECLVCAQP
jgi:hypothetical protein